MAALVVARCDGAEIFESVDGALNDHPDRAAIHLTLVLEGAQAVAQNRSVPQLGKRLMELTENILAAG